MKKIDLSGENWGSLLGEKKIVSADEFEQVYRSLFELGIISFNSVEPNREVYVVDGQGGIILLSLVGRVSGDIMAYLNVKSYLKLDTRGQHYHLFGNIERILKSYLEDRILNAQTYNKLLIVADGKLSDKRSFLAVNLMIETANLVRTPGDFSRVAPDNETFVLSESLRKMLEDLVI